MKMELPEIRPEERTPLVEALLGIIRQLADRVAELERINQELRDELARSKGQKTRPDIKPSILNMPPKPEAGTGEGRRRFGAGAVSRRGPAGRGWALWSELGHLHY